jgi:hypothetical protein
VDLKQKNVAGLDTTGFKKDSFDLLARHPMLGRHGEIFPSSMGYTRNFLCSKNGLCMGWPGFFGLSENEAIS